MTGSANWKASRMSLGVMGTTGTVTAAKLAAEVEDCEDPVGLMTPSIMLNQLHAQEASVTEPLTLHLKAVHSNDGETLHSFKSWLQK